MALTKLIVSLFRVTDNIYPFILLKKLDLCQKAKIFYQLADRFYLDCVFLSNELFNYCAGCFVEKVDPCGLA